MKYISMLNPYSIYHLWQFNEGRKFISKMISSIIKSNGNYELLDYYNRKLNNVRSYSIFESEDEIVLIDFNLNEREINDDLGIINFLKVSSSKNIYFILFNNYTGINTFKDNIYYIYKSDNFIFADNYKKQLLLEPSLTSILYQMDESITRLYLHEEELLNN